MRAVAVAVVAAAAAAAAAAASAAPTDYIRAGDVAAIKALVAPEAAGADARSAFLAVSALVRLGEKVPDAQQLCGKLAKSIGGAGEDVAALHYALGAAEALQCVVAPPQGAVQALEAAVASGNVEQIYHAAAVIDIVRQAKVLEVSADMLAAAVPVLDDLSSDDGLYFGSADGDYASPLYAGFALETLAIIQRHGAKLSAAQQDTVGSLVGAATDLFDAADGDDYVLWWYDESDGWAPSGMTATGQILRALSALAESNKKLGVKAGNLQLVAEYLVENKAVSTVADAYGLATGAHALAAGFLQRPLVATVANEGERVSLMEDKPVTVAVTDLLGKFVGPITAKLESVVSQAEPKKTVLSKQDMPAASQDKGNALYTADVVGAKPKPAPGFYTLTMSAKAEGKKKYIDIKNQEVLVRVTAPIEVRNLEAFVAPSLDKASVGAAARLAPAGPGKAFPGKLELARGGHLFVQFGVVNKATNAAFAPHQAFVTLRGPAGHLTAYATESGEVLSAHITGVEASKQLGAGEYDVDVVVGDLGAESAVTWTIGKVAVAEGRGKRVVDPYAAPEIMEHIPREPEPRAAQTLSIAFTGAVFAPYLVLFALLGRAGANLAGLPSGGGLLPALVFHLGLAAMAALCVVYFVDLDPFVGASYLAGLAVITTAAGYIALAPANKVKED